MGARSSPPCVLLVGYKRPEIVRRQLQVLQTVRPSRLLVCCDRDQDDQEGSRFWTRLIEGTVDWPCDVGLDIADRHLGLSGRITSAIGLALEDSSSVMVLEDDCMPDPTFFSFCETLLRRYETDERVWMIAGGRPRDASRPHGQDYTFSIYPFVWGWATWRSRWNRADLSGQTWTSAMESGLMERNFPDEFERAYWSTKIGRAAESGLWDYLWFLNMLTYGGMCAVPAANLVQNHGFGSEATHTTDSAGQNERSVPLQAMAPPYRHPSAVERDVIADRQALSQVFMRHWQPGMP